MRLQGYLKNFLQRKKTHLLMQVQHPIHNSNQANSIVLVPTRNQFDHVSRIALCFSKRCSVTLRKEVDHTNLTASSASLEATAKISVVGLKVTDVAEVTRFIMALTGLGWFSLRQTSVVYKFTTPETELKWEINKIYIKKQHLRHTLTCYL